MLIAIASLGIIALLAFAISFVAFLVQTSRHRSSGKLAAAAGTSLVLVLLLGGLVNALQGEGSPRLNTLQHVLILCGLLGGQSVRQAQQDGAFSVRIFSEGRKALCEVFEVKARAFASSSSLKASIEPPF